MGLTPTDDENAEMLVEFRTESLEHLEQVEPLLLEVDGAIGESRKDLVNRIFRAVHSIKGVAGFFELTLIERLSHVMESTLMPVRDGSIDYHSDMTDVLLRSVDVLRGLVEALPEKAEADCAALIAELEACIGGTDKPKPTASARPPAAGVSLSPALSSPATDRAAAAPASQPDKIQAALKQGKSLYLIDVPSLDSARTTMESLVIEVATILVRNSDSWIVATVLDRDLLAKAIGVAESTLYPWNPDSTLQEDSAEADVASHLDNQATGAKSQKAAPERQQETIRVPVDLLSKLMNLAGELVLARNQMTNQFSDSDDPRAAAILQTLDGLTSELQGNIMLTRMQRLGVTLKKLPRVVRDLAKKLGKDVRFEVEGEDVELDKSIIEALTDPLTHLVRNALDHGIEVPADRVAKGKPKQGTLMLQAFHEGGQVIIQISDDGAGIDPQKMRAAAVRKGLMSTDAAAALSDEAAQMLIFGAGFSTAATVTDVSGRGVGMDVVRVNIDKLGGKIELHSSVDVGTKLRIRLPLTLAIIPSLLVRMGGERFAIPQINLVELVRMGPNNAEKRIQDVNGKPALRLRGSLVPLVALRSVLWNQPQTTGDLQAAEVAQFAVILRIGPNRLGLVVDSVDDTEEIVVKPLASHLKASRIYAGATLMGDGRVAMILEANAIAAVAKIDFEAVAATTEVHTNDRALGEPLLVFMSGRERFAAPVAHIARVDRISTSSIECIGGKEMVRTRDQILGLLRMDSLLPAHPLELEEYAYVLVPKNAPAGVALLASRLVDTTDFVWPNSHGSSPVVARATIQGAITSLLCLEKLWTPEAIGHSSESERSAA